MKKFTIIALFLIFAATFNSNAKYTQSNMMMGGDVGLGFPTNDFGLDFKTGLGINAVFTYFINPQLAITGTLGYWNFGVKNLNDGVSASATTYPLNAGIQYRFQNGSFQPFVGIESLVFFNGVSSSNGYNKSSTDIGFVPNVGAAFPIAPNVEIRAAIKYSIILNSSAEYNYRKSNTTFFSILGGVHFYI